MNERITGRGIVAAACLSLIATAGPALAHDGAHVHAPGVLAGFLHPFGGLDHVAAAIVAGVLAARLGGRARVAVPAVFLGSLVLSTMLAGTLGVPFAPETGIQLSIVALLAAAVFARPRPLAAATAVVAGAGAFHGLAHAAGVPQGAGMAGYVAGFTLATGLLQLAGFGAATLARRWKTAGA
ncbi:HupE/UreJ family protein [Geminicoccaceae bacterium 1502E]|nr:HupE/UreJ family protein [Geminicoccaceae bacterium 1502E]